MSKRPTPAIKLGKLPNGIILKRNASRVTATSSKKTQTLATFPAVLIEFDNQVVGMLVCQYDSCGEFQKNKVAGHLRTYKDGQLNGIMQFWGVNVKKVMKQLNKYPNVLAETTFVPLLPDGSHDLKRMIKQ